MPGFHHNRQPFCGSCTVFPTSVRKEINEVLTANPVCSDNSPTSYPDGGEVNLGSAQEEIRRVNLGRRVWHYLHAHGENSSKRGGETHVAP